MAGQTGVTGTILVATDGSMASKAAAIVAVQLAAQLHLRISGLCVVDEAVVLDTYGNYHKELIRGGEAKSRSQLVQWFEEQGELSLHWLEEACVEADVCCVGKLAFGGLPDLILKEAETADLLALGRHGLGHRGRTNYLGHNFRAIAHHVGRPLIVGGDLGYWPGTVLVALDGQANSARVLQWAALLERAMEPRQTLVLALGGKGSPVSAESDEELPAMLEAAGLNNYQLVNRRGSPAKAISHIAQSGQVDLILMGSSPHRTLLDWFRGEALEAVLRQTSMPLLVTCPTDGCAPRRDWRQAPG